MPQRRRKERRQESSPRQRQQRREEGGGGGGVVVGGLGLHHVVVVVVVAVAVAVVFAVVMFGGFSSEEKDVWPLREVEHTNSSRKPHTDNIKTDNINTNSSSSSSSNNNNNNNNNNNTNNRAFVFVKPHACGTESSVVGAVRDALERQHVFVRQEGAIASEYMAAHGLVDTHYSAISTLALAHQLPTGEAVSVETKRRFQAAFSLDWDEAVADGHLISAAQAVEAFGISPVELGTRWDDLQREGLTVKLGSGISALVMTGSTIVINGFYFGMRQPYLEEGARIYFFDVEWDPAHMSWKQFRMDFIGVTDPQRARPGSLRRVIFENWAALRLPFQPTIGDNGVHASASPLEALAERRNWLRAADEVRGKREPKPSQPSLPRGRKHKRGSENSGAASTRALDEQHDEFVALLRQQGLTASTIEHALCNPVVQIRNTPDAQQDAGGTHSSTQTRARLFDLVEDLDALQCVHEIARHLLSWQESHKHDEV